MRYPGFLDIHALAVRVGGVLRGMGHLRPLLILVKGADVINVHGQEIEVGYGGKVHKIRVFLIDKRLRTGPGGGIKTPRAQPRVRRTLLDEGGHRPNETVPVLHGVRDAHASGHSVGLMYDHEIVGLIAGCYLSRSRHRGGLKLLKGRDVRLLRLDVYHVDRQHKTKPPDMLHHRVILGHHARTVVQGKIPRVDIDALDPHGFQAVHVLQQIR